MINSKHIKQKQNILGFKWSFKPTSQVKINKVDPLKAQSELRLTAS